MRERVGRINQWIERLQQGDYIKFGSLVVTLTAKYLTMTYSLNNIEIKMVRETQGKLFKDIFKEMRAFLIDIYYDYEWDGRPMSFDKLSFLLGTNKMGAYTIVEKIMNKIRVSSAMLE